MSVLASLVVGADGSTTFNQSSRALSTTGDRERFLARRRLADCILVGGNTARNESYSRTPAPLVIISHSQPELLAINPIAQWWNLGPEETITRASKEFGQHIHCEAGANLLHHFLSLGLIDTMELSVTSFVGGENAIDIQAILQNFKTIERTKDADTTFYTCTQPIMLQK